MAEKLNNAVVRSKFDDFASLLRRFVWEALPPSENKDATALVDKDVITYIREAAEAPSGWNPYAGEGDVIFTTPY